MMAGIGVDDVAVEMIVVARAGVESVAAEVEVDARIGEIDWVNVVVSQVERLVEGSMDCREHDCSVGLGLQSIEVGDVVEVFVVGAGGDGGCSDSSSTDDHCS